jgi:regulator of protease activity HflC (stomatin/prohibitin superfamily)
MGVRMWVLALSLSGCSVVPPGHVGVQVRFGELEERVLEPGFYISPLTRIHHVTVQVQATQAVSTAVTSDLQKVNTSVILNWSRSPDMVREQFEKYPDIDARIIEPAIQETVKSITARHSAAQLVQDRQAVKASINELLGARLSPLGVVIDTVNITDFDYSEEFNDSIEAKVRAEQDSQRALEELEKIKIVANQVEEEAKGKKLAAILVAQGEAEAIRIQGDAIRANPMVLELRKIEKWKGDMPVTLVTDGSSPLLSITPASR